MIRTRPSDPIQGPDRPFPLPYPPSGPQMAMTGTDPMPRPGDPPFPFPPPPPRIALRIGKSKADRRRPARNVRAWRRVQLVAWAVFAVVVTFGGYINALASAEHRYPKRPATACEQAVHDLLPDIDADQRCREMAAQR